MKKNVFIGHPIDWYKRTTDAWAEIIPNFYVTNNFQQLIAMARLGEVNRVMVAVCVTNFSIDSLNSFKASAQRATEKFHEEFPEIPVLASGRLEDIIDGSYVWKPISNENEYYYSDTKGSIDLSDLVEKFFKGDSIINLSCISYKGVERKKHPLARKT